MYMDTILFIAYENSRLLVKGGEMEIRREEWEGTGEEGCSTDFANKKRRQIHWGAQSRCPR